MATISNPPKLFIKNDSKNLKHQHNYNLNNHSANQLPILSKTIGENLFKAIKIKLFVFALKSATKLCIFRTQDLSTHQHILAPKSANNTS